MVIGKISFTKSGFCRVPDRDFYLKNCPQLKLLVVGNQSFSGYTVCEIENVDALEVIEIGDLNGRSFNFYSASLELRSILNHNG